MILKNYKNSMKKILSLLILFLSLNSLSFSQTGTDTSYVILPENIAREVARELIEKDKLKREVSILYAQITLRDILIDNNSQVMIRLQSRIVLLNQINTNRQYQIEEYKKLTSLLETDLKRQRLQKNFYKTSTIAVIAGAGLLYISSQ